MASVKITDNIYWVGAIDWDVRHFHGYLTPWGTTYNAYLILDEKITLIDTVKAPFTEEMFANIREVIDPGRIDIHISNHAEPDHSGSLPALLRTCPNVHVYATANGAKELSAYYRDVSFQSTIVKAGDALCTGRYTFDFIPMPMVHWPDSMSTLLREERILFSNDAMGEHIASTGRFDDEIGLDVLMERAGDYYANIVFPFGAQVKKLLSDLSAHTFSMVAPSHGVILRSCTAEMTAAYARWAGNETDPRRAVVVFDSMWGGTRLMARQLEAEWQAEGYTVTSLCLSDTHVSACMAALLDAARIAVGCSTLNRQVMPTMGAFLAYLKGLAPKNRRGLAFGCYGWSGESIGLIKETLKALGWELLPARRCQWKPA